MNASSAQMAATAREAGYEPMSVEQLRPNRWLMTLRPPFGEPLLVLAQRRPLVVAADVHDLAELLRLRRVATGYLLAVAGRFSPEALAAAREQRHPRVVLCATLPPAGPAPASGALERA
ncbi:MAG TPA: hypothetical protein PKD53_31780 [Chloroflexaceae bacterium]|nr:hypothetical protein [Chloroflexaceae bacterium]